MKTKILWVALAVMGGSLVGVPSPAGAGLSPEARCESRKEKALGNRAVCRARQRSEAAKGGVGNFERCDTQFRKAIVAADKGAARKDTACRWKITSAGTARDLDTGLEWTVPTNDFTVRSRTRKFTWSREAGSGTDGTLFSVFLAELNRDEGWLNSDSTCFADQCDWRMPSIKEYYSIFYTCGGGQCPDNYHPFLEENRYYWTTSRASHQVSWVGSMFNGKFSYNAIHWHADAHAVAVRGED